MKNVNCCISEEPRRVLKTQLSAATWVRLAASNASPPPFMHKACCNACRFASSLSLKDGNSKLGSNGQTQPFGVLKQELRESEQWAELRC